MRLPKFVYPAMGLLLFFSSPPSRAEMDLKAIQVAAKVIGYARPPIPSGAVIAVVGQAANMAGAQTIFGTTTYKLVTNNDAAAYATFVSSAAEANAAGAHALTIGPPDCVEADACVLAIETTPKVLIHLSKAAAARAGVDFDSNFILMVIAR